MKLKNLILIYNSLLLLLLTNVLFAQRQPLSRQDSALLIKYREGFLDNMSKERKREASDFLNKIALTYWNHNQYSEAIKEYEQSLELNEELGNENGIAMISNNLGMLYTDIKNYNRSIQFFNRTLAGRRSQKEKVGMISALINMSVVFNNLGQYDSSIVSLEEALNYARELNDAKQMKSCYGMLSETYEKQGDVEKSFQYFELYKTFHEMIQGKQEEVYRQSAEEAKLKAELADVQKRNKELELIAKNLEIKDYEFANEEMFSILSEQEVRIKIVEQEKELKELRLNEAELLTQRTKERAQSTRNYFIGIFILISSVAILIYRNNRQKRKVNKELQAQNSKVLHQKEELEIQGKQLNKAFQEIDLKNKKITKSINYARRIQSAMLNRKTELKSILPNSFTFLKPKDVVSGDFYWYEKINNNIIIAAIDCTGHGVPGAFMSMIGANLLDQIVLNEKIIAPEIILEKLHSGIVRSLNQDQSTNKDGMDAAICRIDLSNNFLHFSGAKRPLIYIENNKVFSIKGTINGIGGIYSSNHKKSFESHQLSLENKKFYIFSDGYVDQFGGSLKRKFLAKRLQNTLLTTSKYNFEKQQELLEKELLEWQGDNPQTDDILVIGFSN